MSFLPIAGTKAQRNSSILESSLWMDIDSDNMELYNQNEELSREQQTPNVLSLLFSNITMKKELLCQIFISVSFYSSVFELLG